MKGLWFKKWFLEKSTIDSDHQLVLVQQTPAESSLAYRLIWVAIYFCTTVVSFYLGVGLASGELSLIREDYAETKQLYSKQIAELDTLRRDQIMMERNIWVSQQASEELRQEIIRLNDEKSAMARELRFFRGVMDPERAKEGVSIHSAEVRATSKPNLFQWRMVLVQNATLHKVQIGQVTATVNGYKGDDAMSLPIKFDVDGKPSDTRKVEFRYFENLPKEGSWGIVELPAGFEPVSIDTEIKLTSPSRRTIKNSFEWLVEESEA